MKLLTLFFTILLFLPLAHRAMAADICSGVTEDPVELGGNMSRMAAMRAPAKYLELARGITVVTAVPGDALIPYATEQQGRKVIVFPPSFALTVCKMAFATYLHNSGVQNADFDQAAARAARCLDTVGSLRTCLIRFSDDLMLRYRPSLQQMSLQDQKTAFGIYQATLNQIAMHEYAHLFLDHFSRIRNHEIARIDAEFEADLFAVLNGVESGEPESAMYYFFDGMASIEQHTSKFTTQDYESGSCRAGNIENITAFLGISPIVALDASYGGGFTLQHNSPDVMRSFGRKELEGAVPKLEAGACGRIAKAALPEAFGELQRLYSRLEKDADFLFSQEKNLDPARANFLVRDLAQMSVEFRYLQGLAAKTVALLLRRWGIRGHPLTPLVGQIDRLVNTPAINGNFESEDLGRLLLSQGIAILQERRDLPPATRQGESFELLRRAVFYNPAEAEGWQNLAFISFMRGNCKQAATFADKAAATLSPTESQDTHQSVEFFAARMKQWSMQPETCQKEGSNFHPY